MSDCWIDSSKNLSKWEELKKISADTENYELKLECSKMTKDFHKKFLLLESDCKHKNESEGIVDLTTILLDHVDFKNNDLTKQRNQKDLLFVYNFFYQNNNNIKHSFDNLKKVINNH